MGGAVYVGEDGGAVYELSSGSCWLLRHSGNPCSLAPTARKAKSLHSLLYNIASFLPDLWLINISSRPGYETRFYTYTHAPISIALSGVAFFLFLHLQIRVIKRFIAWRCTVSIEPLLGVETMLYINIEGIKERNILRGRNI